MPERPRLQGGEEGSAFIRKEIIDHHFVVRGQRPGARQQFVDRKLEASSVGWLRREVRHLEERAAVAVPGIARPWSILPAPISRRRSPV